LPAAISGYLPPASPTSTERVSPLPTHKPDQHAAHLLELLAPLGAVSARRMFGGTGLFLRGLMFGLIADEELFFKVGPANQPDYEAAGEAPFSYETKNGTNTIRSYWRCPPDLLDDAETFRQWARRAVDASIAASRAKPKTR
jgi:DNA transformation protein